MAAPSLFFYDLETSGLYPNSARIMQFAGQRVDLELNPVGEPLNYLIRLSEDILPDPSAILVHGIEPQQTILEGLSEAEFLNEFYSSVVQPDTTFVGYNNVRFDDEFMRYLNYRNLRDPYAWAWENHCSRWDLLDLTRITRALRPDGINWPQDKNGKNTNKLGLIASANKISHLSAHDALSDVQATIDVARLIKQHQPKLFEYLYKLRLKDEAAKLVNTNQPFIYTSSHYPSENLHTTIVVKVADNLPSPGSVLVYDLRYDPTPWLDLSAEQLAEAWRYHPERKLEETAKPMPLPVKTLRLNRCPAIAPLEVASHSEAVAQRIGLDFKLAETHLQLLQDHDDGTFSKRLNMALEILNREQEERYLKQKQPLDARLYEGFYSDHDRNLMLKLHADNETAERVRELREQFNDPRLKQLCSFYLARNYKRELNASERQGWDKYLHRHLLADGDNSLLAGYFKQIADLAQERQDARSQVLLEDLKLYGESLIPTDYPEL